MVKKLLIPDDFNGLMYHDRYGEYPQSSEEGFLDVPDNLTQEDIDDCIISIEDHKKIKIEKLWTCATHYELSFIANGAYTALLEAKLAGSSKATEFGNFIKSLWTEYYNRRDAVMAATDKISLESVSEDFSTVGEPPYSIREVLFEEIL